MDRNVLQQLIAARKTAEGSDGPDKQNARVLFHTLLWNNWPDIIKELQKKDQYVLKDKGGKGG